METPMHPRANPAELSAPVYKKFLDFSMSIHGDAIDNTLRDLINIRASQINGCAFCLDMHVKEAKIHGERELRLHHLAIWRESALFTPRERAALTWTEALTRLPVEGISDSLFEDVRAVFSDQEISDLSFAIIAINGWNRLSIGFANVPGSLDALYGLNKAGLS
jgi:AhpD family alkylhydroperoxidase